MKPPVVGSVVAEQAFHQCGLAGAVFAEQAVNAAGRDFQRNFGQGMKTAEMLADADCLDTDGVGHGVMVVPARKLVAVADGAEHAALHLDHVQRGRVVGGIGGAEASASSRHS